MNRLTRCTHCQTPSRIAEEDVNKTMQCPSCQATFFAAAVEEPVDAVTERPPERVAAPPSRGRFRQSDRYADRLPEKKSSSGVWIILLVLGLFGGFFLLILLVCGGIMFLGYRQSAAQRQAAVVAEAEAMHIGDARMHMEAEAAKARALHEKAFEDLRRLDDVLIAPQEPPPIVDFPKLRLTHLKNLDAFHAAVFTSDSRSVLILFADRVLRHFTLPEFTQRGEYRLANEGYRAVLDAQNRLFVAGTVNIDPNRTIPKERIGAGDLDVYDLSDVLAGKLAEQSKLQPMKSFPIGGIVSDLQRQPDGDVLFALDETNKRLLRFRTSTLVADGSVADLPWPCSCFALSATGGTIFVAGASGIVARAHLKKEQPIDYFRVPDSGPIDVQVASNGFLYVNSRNEQTSQVFVLDTNGTVAGKGYIRFRGFQAIQLTRDGRHLIGSDFTTSPARLTAYPTPSSDSVPFRVPEAGACSLDANVGAAGRMFLSPDGRFLLCDAGRVVRVGD